MRKIPMKEQFQMNGGKYYYTHCHKDGYEYKASSQKGARKKMRTHIALKKHTGVNYWGDGLLTQCKNY